MSKMIKNIPSNFKNYNLQKLDLLKASKNVPVLPLPPLKSTIEIYKQWILPYIKSNDQFQKQQKLLNDFQKNIGSVLQKRLQQRCSLQRGWLNELWENKYFYSNPDHNGFNVNPAYILSSRHPINQQASMTTIAAKYLFGSSLYFKQLISNRIQPDTIRNQPLCPQQYKYIFNCCRIPGIQQDYTACHYSFENNHSIIMCRNRFFKIRVFDKNDQVLSVDAIDQQLKQIVAICTSKQAEQNGVGFLTGLPRRKWAQARERLIQNEINRQSLQKIQSCLQLLCLQVDNEVNNIEQWNQLVLTGNRGENKFFDKVIQFVVSKNAKVGINFEHSRVDGLVAKEYVYKSQELWLQNQKKYSEKKQTQTNKIQELKFILSQQSIQDIRQASQFLQNIRPKFSVFLAKPKIYGKKQIKQWGIHIDTFCHLSMILALYKMKGRLPRVYRTSTLRQFRYGRIQSSRPVSIQTLKWLQSIDNQTISNKQRYELLQKAVKASDFRRIRTFEGQCTGRHLLALKQVCKEGQNPELFEDQMYKTMFDYDLLVTSAANLSPANYGHNYLSFSEYGGNKESFGLTLFAQDNEILFICAKAENAGNNFDEYINKSMETFKKIIEQGKQ